VSGSLVTALLSLFLHGGWAHVIGNMVFLWVFGDNVEDRLGHGRYILFYLLSGLAATLGHALAEPHSALPAIGASGAISACSARMSSCFRGRASSPPSCW
jgi:membrane associated rhomboid family serine protease